MGTASNSRRRDIPLPRSAVTLDNDDLPPHDDMQWSFFDFHRRVSAALTQIQDAAEEVPDTATVTELDARNEIARQAKQMLDTLQRRRT